jgi:hypothetical protein
MSEENPNPEEQQSSKSAQDQDLNTNQESSRFVLDQEYTVQQLLKKDKAELDKLKLVSELVSQKKKNAVEWVKALTIPILVAFLSLLSTSIITKSNHDDAALGNDKKYIRDLDMEIRKNKMKTPEDLDYYDRCIRRLTVFRTNNPNCADKEILSILIENKTELDLDSLDLYVEQLKQSLSPKDSVTLEKIVKNDLAIKNNEERLRHTDNESEKTKIVANLKILKDKSDQLLESSPNLAAVFNQASDLSDNAKIQIDKVEIKDSVNTDTSPIAWFKEDNFLIFDNIKVLLDSIDPDNNAITFSAYYVTKDDVQSIKNPIFENKHLSSGYSMLLNDEHTLNLITIDHAGRNPFTMAAYVSCTTKLSPPKHD